MAILSEENILSFDFIVDSILSSYFIFAFFEQLECCCGRLPIFCCLDLCFRDEPAVIRIWEMVAGTPDVVLETDNVHEDVDMEVCGYCGYESYDREEIVNHVFACSQLNGNNGEYTNTDDVELGDLKRVRKEAKNRMIHGSSTNHKKKTGDLPKINKPCREFANGECKRDNCRFLHEEKKVQPGKGEEPGVPIKDEVKDVVVDDEESYGFCFSFMDIRYLIKDICVHDESFTWVERDLEFHCRLPTFNAFGVEFPSKKVIVSERLHLFVLNKIGVVPNERRNYTALYNFVTRLMSGCFDAERILDQIQFFAFKNIQKCAPGDAINLGVHSMTSVNDGKIRILPLSMSGERDYQYNAAWKILESSGFSMDSDDDGRWVNRPMFNTITECPRETPKNFRALFQFSSVNPFQIYGNCTMNLLDAMSRLFKCRGDSLDTEMQMRRAQFNLLGAQCHQDINVLARICDARVVNFDLVTRSVYGGMNNRRLRNIYHFPAGESEFLEILKQAWINGYWERLSWWDKLWDWVSSKYSIVHNFVIGWLYTPIFEWYYSVNRLRALASLPHPKMCLRTQWVSDERSLERILNNTGSFESKFKWEFAKVGKAGRLYATIEMNSLVANETMMMLKRMTAEPVFLGFLPNGGRMWARYSDAADVPTSDRLFRDLTSLGLNDVVYCFFSDDGFVVVNGENGIELYETDISSCDASNGFPVSAILLWLARSVGMEKGMCELLAISSKHTTIHNPGKKDEYVRLLPETTFEYSGETLTTVKNNCASIAIAYGAYCRLRNGNRTGDALKLGAQDFGWVLTVDKKVSFNAVTFLKRAYSTNSCKSWLVYGPILRSLGCVDGELTPLKLGISKLEFNRMSYSEMTDLLLRKRVDGLVNEPSSPIMNALRARAYGTAMSQEYVISMNDVLERYKVDQIFVEILISQILDLKFGDILFGVFLEEIYHVDYGNTPGVLPVILPNNLGDPDDVV